MFRINKLGLIVAIVFLQSTLCITQADTPLLGGYANQKIRECEKAIRKTNNKLLRHFLRHRIVKCETQVVAGLNYRITFNKKNAKVKVCSILIYKDLQGTYTLTIRDDQSDCVKQVKDQRLVVSSSK